MSFKIKSSTPEYSKSMPPNEFQIYISSADSGIDSDTSPNSSTKLANSLEEIEPIDNVDPTSFILGKGAAETDRIDGINKSIDWLKEELTKMKKKDRELAKTMITIRSKIAEYKTELDKRDNGYDSDVDKNRSTDDNDTYQKETWKLVSTDGAFPTNGLYFENNKRATWAI